MQAVATHDRRGGRGRTQSALGTCEKLRSTVGGTWLPGDDVDSRGLTIDAPAFPAVDDFEHVQPVLGREDRAAAEAADGEDVLVTGRDKLLEPHATLPSPGDVHVGEKRRQARARLVGLAHAAYPYEDVGRRAVCEPVESAVEHEKPAGHDLVELNAAVSATLTIQPLAETFCGLERGVQTIEVLDVGECRKASVVIPEVRIGHRGEPRALAVLNAVRADGGADPKKLVGKESGMARIVLWSERERA